MGHYDDPELSAETRPPRRGRIALTAVAALAAGLFGGYLLRYLTEETPAPPPPAPITAPAVAPAAPPPDRTPCVRVAENGSALVGQVQRGVTAIGHLDPQELQRVLDEIQRLQGEMTASIGGCQQEFATPAPTPAAPPAPVPPLPTPVPPTPVPPTPVAVPGPVAPGPPAPPGG